MMMGASCDTPRVCLPLCGLARGQSCRRVVLGLLDGCGGMRIAHGVTLKSDLSDLSDLSDKMGGVSVYPVGLLAAAWFGLGERVPWGVLCPSQSMSAKRDSLFFCGNLEFCDKSFSLSAKWLNRSDFHRSGCTGNNFDICRKLQLGTAFFLGQIKI